VCGGQKSFLVCVAAEIHLNFILYILSIKKNNDDTFSRSVRLGLETGKNYIRAVFFGIRER